MNERTFIPIHTDMYERTKEGAKSRNLFFESDMLLVT